MPIELESYICPHCEAEFTVNEVDGLAYDIDAEVDNAATSERREVERLLDPLREPQEPKLRAELVAEVLGS